MHWYAELSAARQSGFSSPAPIGWADIQAWAGLMQLQLEPWQVAVLRQLDDLWRTAWAAGQEKKSTPSR